MWQQMQIVTKHAKIPANLPLTKSLLKLVQELSTYCSKITVFACPSFTSILKNNLHKFSSQSGVYNPSTLL